MPRPERPVDPEDGAVARFAIELRELRRCAGSPGYRELAQRVHYSPTTLAQAARGESLPSLAVTLAYVRGCGGDAGEWERRWRATAAELDPEPSRERADDIATNGCAPYVGLAAYGPEDTERFHGRERIVDELVTRVAAHRFVTVLGPTGTGKSSLLRAGFLPRLTAGGKTRVALFTPGARPLEECAVHLARFLDVTAGLVAAELTADARGLHRLVKQALVGRPSETEIVLVIDQFEEVFTLCRDADERAKFVAALVTASQSVDSRCRIVLSVRADFYSRCLLETDLATVLTDGQVAVCPMTVDELRQVIVQPARLAGCMVEGSLLATLVAHAHGRVGALPLLSHALLETWRRRSGNTLTLAGFERAGGIDGALTKTAEAVFASLTENQQSAARQLFLRLVALGEGTSDTKRRVSNDELDEDGAAILAAFSDARLVVLSEHGAEITHEALIEAWPRLRSWLVDDREGQRIHRQLTEATATWQEHDRDPGALLRGIRLAVVTEWARHHHGAANKAEAAFLNASTNADERERTAVRRRGRVLRGLVALLVMLLVATTLTAIQAMRAQETATRQSNTAIALNAIREAERLVSTNPALAAQISLAAYQLYEAPATTNSLIAHSAAATASRLPVGGVNLSLAPGGRVIADARSDLDKTRLFRISGGRADQIAEVSGGGFPSRFSPDGRTLLTVNRNAVPLLLDVSNPANPRILATMPQSVLGAVFSPQGDLLVTTDANLVRPDPALGIPEDWTEGATSRIWNIADPTRPRPVAKLHDVNAVVTVFADHRKVLVTVSRGGPTTPAVLTLWDLTNPAHPRSMNHVDLPLGVRPQSATFADNDRILYLGDSAGEITAWRVTTAGQLHKVSDDNVSRSLIEELISSPDDRTLISRDAAGQLTSWDISTPPTPENPTRLASCESTLSCMTFADDGSLMAVVLATTRDNSILVQWQLDAQRSSQILCARSGPRITETDWNKYLAGAPYQPPCEQTGP